MSMISRATLRQILPFAPLAAAAALSVLVAATDNDLAAVPAAGAAPADASVLLPVDGAVPAMHVPGAARLGSASEPDPESFDRVGLEHWWHDYQLAHSLRAENSTR